MMRNLRRRKRAFTMIEMLFVLGLLGVITLAGGRLFVTAMKTTHSAAQAQNRAARFDSAVSALRRDVWSAQKVTVASDGAVTINGSHNSATTWTSKSGALIRHVNGGHDQTWNIEAKATFAPADLGLELQLAPSKSAEGAELHFDSEWQLLRRMQ